MHEYGFNYKFLKLSVCAVRCFVTVFVWSDPLCYPLLKNFVVEQRTLELTISHTVRKSVQRPFRPPSLYAQSQKLTENEYFWFMPDGSFRAHLLVV